MMIVSLALLLADPASVTLRPNAPPVTQAAAAVMTPAALGDALLAPGHPPIVERMLPDIVAPPPPSYVAPLDVRLFAPAVVDAASGFCVKHSWRVTGTTTGIARDVSPAPTLYRQPPAIGGCDGPHSAFFSVLSDDSPRALSIVRLMSAAVHKAVKTRFPISVDDNEGREAAKSCHHDHNLCDIPHGIITNGRKALALFPVDAIWGVGRTGVFGADLLSKAELTAPDGRQYEHWELAAQDYTIDAAFDGDRVVVMKIRRQIPPPF